MRIDTLWNLLGEACSDLGSRLFMRIREELGLAYYVGAQSQPGMTPGSFSFTLEPRRNNWRRWRRN